MNTKVMQIKDMYTTNTTPGNTYRGKRYIQLVVSKYVVS